MWFETTTYPEEVGIPENDNGWNDADQANEPIFCPNHDTWYMELCEQADSLQDQKDMSKLLEDIE